MNLKPVARAPKTTQTITINPLTTCIALAAKPCNYVQASNQLVMCPGVVSC